MTVLEYLKNAAEVVKMLDSEAVMSSAASDQIGSAIAEECMNLEDFEMNCSMFKYPDMVKKYVDAGYDKSQIAVIMNAVDDNIIVDKYISQDFDSFEILLIALAMSMGEDPECYRKYTSNNKIDPVFTQCSVKEICRCCCILKIKGLHKYIQYVAEDYESDDSDESYRPYDISTAVQALLHNKHEIEDFVDTHYPQLDGDLNVFAKVVAAVGLKLKEKKFLQLTKADGIYGAVYMLYQTGVWDKLKEKYPAYFMGEIA